MFLVKLNAINSTNSYLKDLSKAINTKNWTVVSTEFQTSGRGQMHTKWESERSKNLICSVLIKFDKITIPDQFYLNCAISLGIYNALKDYNLPQLRVKWPNDIMAVNRKLGGILIENSVMTNKIHQSVVGIGLNVNQESFPAYLPKAVSMNQILKRIFDRSILLNQVIKSLKEQITLLEERKFETLHQNYEEVLYKKNIPQVFENKDNQRFLGIVLGITSDGKLIVEKEDHTKQEFGFKEIKFV